MRNRPDLIMPIRDRRRCKRVLTLKNFRNFALGIAVLLLAVTIQSDLRHLKPGQYGRLFSKQVPSQPEIAPRKIEVVREAPPVPDQTAADPLLLASAAREQYLGVNTPPALPNEAPAIPPPPASASSDVAIVSGPNGVTIVRGEAKRQPALSGGIFRQ
jgi:hypothetical protein